MTILHLVDSPTTGSADLTDTDGRNALEPTAGTKPDLQRWAVTSGSISCFLTVLVITAVVAANGGGMASIAAGVMVAGFDGFPFGAMIGVMLYYMKHPEVP
jgi:hypothetical protein